MKPNFTTYHHVEQKALSPRTSFASHLPGQFRIQQDIAQGHRLNRKPREIREKFQNKIPFRVFGVVRG